MRQTAATLRRCFPELTAIGPPGYLLGPTYRLARRACAAFTRGANVAIAAARDYTVNQGPKQTRLGQLLNQLDAAVNRGTNLIVSAYYGAPVIQGS